MVKLELQWAVVDSSGKPLRLCASEAEARRVARVVRGLSVRPATAGELQVDKLIQAWAAAGGRAW